MIKIEDTKKDKVKVTLKITNRWKIAAIILALLLISLLVYYAVLPALERFYSLKTLEKLVSMIRQRGDVIMIEDVSGTNLVCNIAENR